MFALWTPIADMLISRHTGFAVIVGVDQVDLPGGALAFGTMWFDLGDILRSVFFVSCQRDTLPRHLIDFLSVGDQSRIPASLPLLFCSHV